MSWIEFAEFPLADDLGPLNKALSHHNIPHRFTEESGRQKLWLAGPQFIEPVQQIFEAVQNQGYRAPDALEDTQYQQPSFSALGVLTSFITTPVCIGLIALGFCGFLAYFLKLEGLLNALVYWPEKLGQGQLWRLITPTFLHFDITHILFNAVWIWVLGRRLEICMGSGHVFLLTVASALVGNIGQGVLGSPTSIFGGLSVVVYGYFAGLYMLHKARPRPESALPQGIYIVTIVMLVAGFTGVFSFFMGSNVANWAHLFGLVGGAMYMALYLLFTRQKA